MGPAERNEAQKEHYQLRACGSFAKKRQAAVQAGVRLWYSGCGFGVLRGFVSSLMSPGSVCYTGRHCASSLNCNHCSSLYGVWPSI